MRLTASSSAPWVQPEVRAELRGNGVRVNNTRTLRNAMSQARFTCREHQFDHTSERAGQSLHVP